MCGLQKYIELKMGKRNRDDYSICSPLNHNRIATVQIKVLFSYIKARALVEEICYDDPHDLNDERSPQRARKLVLGNQIFVTGDRIASFLWGVKTYYCMRV